MPKTTELGSRGNERTGILIHVVSDQGLGSVDSKRLPVGTNTPWLWQRPGRGPARLSQLEVFWVSMEDTSLNLQMEKLRPREESMCPGHGVKWGHDGDLKAESTLTPGTSFPDPRAATMGRVYTVPG